MVYKSFLTNKASALENLGHFADFSSFLAAIAISAPIKGSLGIIFSLCISEL